MGYDFTFTRLAPNPKELPFHPDKDFDGKLLPFLNYKLFQLTLLEHGGFRLNGAPFEGRQSLWWDTPDGGSLNITVLEDWVSVDTHAHWEFVRAVYDLLCTIETDLLVVDNQTSTFYDSNSFQQFADESYRGKES